MSIQSEYTRLVNKYLDSNMSGSEKFIFEEQLTSDPLLKAEFDHQNEIIHGLKEYRKMQLKTRLDNVTINPGILGVISQSTTVKTLSYVVTSILVGTGSYMYFANEEVVHVNMPVIESKLEFVTPEISPFPFDMQLDYRYAKTAKPSLWIEEPEEAPEKESLKKEQANTIDFNVPEVKDGVEEDVIPEPDQILEKVITQNVPFTEAVKIDKVDIENIVTNRYKFHYKLDNNKLYLYGKFEASPYEIIEINSYQAKKLFFYYNGQYYRLHQDINDISPLIKIQDQKVINELRIIKSKG